MATYFSRIGWGFLLVLIDVRIGGFDLAADALGYGMMFFAMDELAKAYPPYRIPSAIAKALTAGAVLELLPGFLPSGADTTEWTPLLYGNVMLLAKLILVYTFLVRVERHMDGTATEPFLAAVRARRWFYAVVAGASLFVAPFAVNWPDRLAPYGFFLLFMSVLAEALVAAACFRARKERTNEDGKTPTQSA
ncbi:hypothetical protein MO973_11970 [Paenibacillus sp. TRM 82003]|nr:hypothetical protein [Paenibacillus sp. TRM 82003]